MLNLELCDSCRIHFPEEYAEECQHCRAQLCPACSEDGNHACEEAEPLPLAA
jgi:hypothetical protein